MVKREPLEKGTMWSYSKQRQPWQLQKRLQTTLPAASLRHLSGWRPGTVSAFAQHMLLDFPSKYLGLSSLLLLLLLLRERFGDAEEEEEELILLLLRLSSIKWEIIWNDSEFINLFVRAWTELDKNCYSYTFSLKLKV